MVLRSSSTPTSRTRATSKSRTIVIFDHSDADLAATTHGNDYIAGGPDNDVIFGGLGNDISRATARWPIDAITGNFAFRPAVSTWLGSLPVRNRPTSARAGRRIGAWDPSQPLFVSPSTETATDGDDYIEGNGGNDVIFGNLGQDDIIGGSSTLFGLDTVPRPLRPDGTDIIFGGAGTAGRSASATTYGDAARRANVHARDADTIVGDNAQHLPAGRRRHP